MKKLRVAVLIDAWFPFQGGGQVHVSEITKRLTSACEFTIYHAQSTAILTRGLWALSVIPQILLDNKRNRFDLIHAHAYIAGVPGKILSEVLNLPVVFTLHGSNMMDIRERLKTDPNLKDYYHTWKYVLEKWLLTGIRYDHEISVSEHFQRFANANQKISYVLNGVDTTPFDRIRIGKRKVFTYLFVGRNDPLKGLKILEEAMTEVQRRFPKVRLIKITEGVSRDKLILFYKTSHIFVLPSLSEGMPLTLLEAWAAKIPVIATDVSDNRKLVKDGINGFLVPPGDSKALAQAMIRAYTHPKLANLGREGYNLVSNNFSWDKVAEETLKVYRETMHGA